MASLAGSTSDSEKDKDQGGVDTGTVRDMLRGFYEENDPSKLEGEKGDIDIIDRVMEAWKGKEERLIGEIFSNPRANLLLGHQEKVGGGGTSAKTTTGDRGRAGQYEGELFDGKRHGKGKIIYEGTKNVYEGEWVNDEATGQGSYICGPGAWFGQLYVGLHKDGAREGEGELTSKNGNKYIGSWKRDKKDGKGKMVFANGDVYEGSWMCDVIDGKGSFTWGGEFSGQQYTGEFKLNQRHGEGKLVSKNGDVYIGEFRHNKKHGKGKMVHADGRLCEGIWDCDKSLSPAQAAMKAPKTIELKPGSGYNVRIRAEKSCDSKHVGTIPHGQTVRFIEPSGGLVIKAGEWVKVAPEEYSRLEGWSDFTSHDAESQGWVMLLNQSGEQILTGATFLNGSRVSLHPTTGWNARVRKGQSFDTEHVGTIPQGQTVKFIEPVGGLKLKVGEWVKVAPEEYSRLEGWSDFTSHDGESQGWCSLFTQVEEQILAE